MEKTLTELDEYYSKAVRKSPKAVRIEYCLKVIDKHQFIIANSGRFLSSLAKEELMQKIDAAKKEIEHMKNESQDA